MSVVVPVYNRLALLGATINGVLSQIYPSWELIIVDDGSQEDVAGMIAEYTDPRIRLIRQDNQGNAAARNTGIRASTGEYAVCLDSDDIWAPDFLRLCAEYLADHSSADVVYTQAQRIDSQGEALPGPAGPEPQNGDLLAPLLMGYPILPSSAVIRRSCFERWGVYTAGLDDWELWLRWAARGCHFACIEQPLLHYRIHDQNLNLDYDRRRAAHFAMLDRFYEQERLPETALRLRAQARANQHFRFAVLAWRLGRADDGAADFAEAALLDPNLLADIEFYTRVACAHQGRNDAVTSTRLNLDTAETTLQQCLAGLFGRPELPGAIRVRRNEAYGFAYLALARVAYGMAHDMKKARRWLWRAERSHPQLATHSDWAAWLARSVVGHSRVRRVRRLLRVGAKDA